MTKVFLCPHFSAHVESTRAIERVAIDCAFCGPLSWSNVIPPDRKDIA